MLTVTDQAATAIDGILASRDLPDEAGVRVSAEFNPANGDTAGPELQLQVVEGPHPGDQVVDGTSVYLEPEVAALLDERTLDAEKSGETLRFEVR
ncbi:MAG: HesB/YadR/YfhF-family protein [Solirubrobacterales bacterium]